MSFSQVIEDKIKALQDEKEVLRSEVLSPDFHVNRMASIVENVIPQIHDLDLSVDELKVEFESILRQIPRAMQEGWVSHTQMVKELDDTISRHNEMKDMYLEWEEEQKLRAAADERLKEEIESGAIQEPSTRTGIRRKTGERPPLTLGRYRRLTQDAEGEDQ